MPPGAEIVCASANSRCDGRCTPYAGVPCWTASCGPLGRVGACELEFRPPPAAFGCDGLRVVCVGIGWDGLRVAGTGIGCDGLRAGACTGIGCAPPRVGAGPRSVDWETPAPGAGRAPGSPRMGEGRPIE